MPAEHIAIGPRRAVDAVLATRPGGIAAAAVHAAYVDAIRALGEDDTVARVRALRPSDDLVVVLLTRLLLLPSPSSPTLTRTRPLEAIDFAQLDLADIDRRLPHLSSEGEGRADEALRAIARFVEAFDEIRHGCG